MKLTGKLSELMRIIGISKEDISDSVDQSEENVIRFNRNFDNRLRIQKIVFLIEKKTKEFQYPYSLYLRGPYSKELAKEYYSLNTDSYSESDEPMSEESKKLANILSEKDNTWLEIASTIVMFSESYNTDKAVARTKEFKVDVLRSENKAADYVDSVYEDIKRLGML
jgi:uncharacterized protein YwgA